MQRLWRGMKEAPGSPFSTLSRSLQGVHTAATVLGLNRERWGQAMVYLSPWCQEKGSHWIPTPILNHNTQPSPTLTAVCLQCAARDILSFLQPSFSSSHSEASHLARGAQRGASGPGCFSSSSPDCLLYSVLFISLDFSKGSWEKFVRLVFKHYIFKNIDFNSLIRFRKTQPSAYIWFFLTIQKLRLDRNFLSFITTIFE